MKTIGRTNEGNYLVEITNDEFTEFSRLHEAVTGKTVFEHFHRGDNSRTFEFDFSNVFHVIRAFYEANFKINEFQGFIDSVKEQLKEKEKES